LVFCIVMINTSYGQFEAGKRMIGGGIGFNTATNDRHSSPILSSAQTHTGFGTNVSISKFASPSLIKGVGVIYSYNYFHSDIDHPLVDRVERSHQVGLFINRTKLQPIGKKLYLAFTGKLTGLYGFGKSDYTQTEDYTDSKSYTASVNAEIGIWYQLNQRFILTGEFNNLFSVHYNYGTYITATNTTVTEGNSSSFNISSGLSGVPLNAVHIGLRYILK
jgi:hypothetical protein